MSLPWSSKGFKATPVSLDELMIIDSADANPATQNKRILIGSISVGEVNTSSNDGAGDGWAKAKVGVDLPFKSLITTAPISTTVNTNDLTLTLDQLVDVDISASAQIAFSKLAPLSDGFLLVGSNSNVPTSVPMSGDATIINSGLLTISNDAVDDNKIATHTSTKITINNKPQLNSNIVYNDQANTYGLFAQQFPALSLQISNPAETFQYRFQSSAITANRNVVLPLLTASDTFVFVSQAQSLTNKTLIQPTISDFTNANHDHADAAGGGNLTNSALTSGVFSNITGVGTQTQDLDMSTNLIKTLGSPIVSSDAANKQYVDEALQGLSWKDAAILATTANITLNGNQSIDGILTVTSDRILVKDQTSASENGLYSADAGAWTRTLDADSESDLDNMSVFIQQGTVNADTSWVLTTDTPIIVDVTPLFYAQIAGSFNSPLTTTGDLLGFDTGDNRIPVGTNGQVLTANNAVALGVEWTTLTITPWTSDINAAGFALLDANYVEADDGIGTPYANAGSFRLPDDGEIGWRNTANDGNLFIFSSADDLNFEGFTNEVHDSTGVIDYSIADEIDAGSAIVRVNDLEVGTKIFDLLSTRLEFINMTNDQTISWEKAIPANGWIGIKTTTANDFSIGIAPTSGSAFTPEYNFSDTSADWLGNNLTNVGFLESNATNPASIGAVRLGTDERIVWRNDANDADLSIYSTSDELTIEGWETIVVPTANVAIDLGNADVAGIENFGMNGGGSFDLGDTPMFSLVSIQYTASNLDHALAMGNLEIISWEKTGSVGYGSIGSGASDEVIIGFSATNPGAVIAEYTFTETGADFLSNNLTMGAAYIDLGEITTPAAPAAATGRIYTKDVSGATHLFIQDDTTETDLNLGGSVSPLTTKGDIYTYDTADARLPVGANGQVLSANSATATGLQWIPAPGGSQTPWTSDIDADGFDLVDLSNIEFRATTGSPAITQQAIYNDADIAMTFNVPTGDVFRWRVNGVLGMQLNNLTLNLQNSTSISQVNGITTQGVITLNPSGGGYFQFNGAIASPGNSGIADRGNVFLDSGNLNHLTIRRNDGIDVDLESGGGSQTPITQDIAYAGFDISDLSILEFRGPSTADPGQSNSISMQDDGGVDNMVFHVNDVSGEFDFITDTNTIPTVTIDSNGISMIGKILFGPQRITGTDLLRIITFGTTASAVNYFNMEGATAGNGVRLETDGSDTNVDLILSPKGFSDGSVFLPSRPLKITERTTPTAPGGGLAKIYPKDVAGRSHLFIQDDVGEVDLNLVAQTPWTSNIDGAGFNLENVGIYSTNATNVSSVGTIRLGDLESIGFRNSTNDADYTIVSDDPTITFNGWETVEFPDATLISAGAAALEILEIEMGGMLNMNGFEQIGVGFIESNAGSPADAGFLRMGNTELLAWRDFGDTANGTLTYSASDQFLFNSALNIGNNLIKAVTDPVDGSDAATKSYVDNLVNGLSWKNPAVVATTGNITLSGNQTIDGVLTVNTDRVLVKDQTSGAENGVYAANSGAWSRTTDADTEADLLNMSIYISQGTANQDTSWVLTTDAPIVVDTTVLVYAQVGAGAGNPLTTKGDIFGYDTANARIPVGTDGQVLTANSAVALGVDYQTPAGGDVVGPGSSTDNEIAIYDSTTGKIIQNNGASAQAITIDDNSNIAGIRSEQFVVSNTFPAPTVPYTQYGNSGTGTFDLENNVPTGSEHSWHINGTEEYNFTATEATFSTNNIIQTTAYHQMQAMAAPASSGSALVGRLYQDSGNSNHLTISRNGVPFDLEAGGGGDVTGPASATDQAVSLFDSTTGKLIKNSDLVYDFASTKQLTLPGPIILSAAGTVPAGTNTYLREDANNLDINVAAAQSIILQFGGGGNDYVFTSTGADFSGNTISNADFAGELTAATVTVASGLGAGITYSNGIKQTFNPSSANAGLNVGAQADPDPSSPVNGDIYYNSTNNKFRAYENGVWIDAVGGGTGDVTGPASSADTELVRFSGVTGKIIQATTLPVLMNAAGVPTWPRTINFTSNSATVPAGGVGYIVNLLNEMYYNGSTGHRFFVNNVQKISISPTIMGLTEGYKLQGNSDATEAAFRDTGHTADPSSASAGDFYFNTTSNKFRSYNGATWDELGGAVSDTPWTEAHDFAGFLLTWDVGATNDITTQQVGNVLVNQLADNVVGIGESWGTNDGNMSIKNTNAGNVWRGELRNDNTVTDASGFFQITSAITPASDTGTVPIMVFDSRQNDDTTVTTRDLFAWRNQGVDMMSLSRAGVMTFNNVSLVDLDLVRENAATASNPVAGTFLHMALSSAIAWDRSVGNNVDYIDHVSGQLQVGFDNVLEYQFTATTIALNDNTITESGGYGFGTSASASTLITGDADGMILSVPTGDDFSLKINAVDEYTFSATALDVVGNDIDNIQNLIHDISASGTDIDFTEDEMQTISIAANTTFTTANRAAGKSKVLKITTDGTLRTLTFPGWDWTSNIPASQAANKNGYLTLTCFGATDSTIVASYLLGSL